MLFTFRQIGRILRPADYAASFLEANLEQRPIPQPSGPRGRFRFGIIRHAA